MLLFQACSYVLFAMHLKDKAHVSRKIFSVCLAESSAEHGLSPPLLQSRVMMKSRSSLEMLEDEKRSFFPRNCETGEGSWWIPSILAGAPRWGGQFNVGGYNDSCAPKLSDRKTWLVDARRVVSPGTILVQCSSSQWCSVVSMEWAWPRWRPSESDFQKSIG